MSRRNYGVVSIAAADLRRTPRHDSELRSQLLLGEVVRILPARKAGGWVRAEGLADGYAGWLRDWSIVPASETEARGWLRRAGLRVIAPLGHLRAAGSNEILMPVFLGARLEPLRSAPGRAPAKSTLVRLPDGRRAWLGTAALAPAKRHGISLRERLRSLMGVPYLWGGRTPAGFDCSGLTQIVLAEQGVSIPRDAKDQFRSSRKLRRGETPDWGDLVFFSRPGESVSHVGLATGSGTFVHCRGFVREASLNPDNELCDRELLPQLRGYRRPGSKAIG